MQKSAAKQITFGDTFQHKGGTLSRLRRDLVVIMALGFAFMQEAPLASAMSISWGQWLGGSNGAAVDSLAINGNNIYTGGWASTGSTTWGESITWQGSYSGGIEVFVVKIADGGTPSIAWGQWLGGSGDDSISNLAVNNDEIYVGGYAPNATNWGEAITWYGSYSGSYEGFVIKIADGATPSIAWGQWLGGSNADEIFAFAVNGDEIYAGGFAQGATNWESIAWQGSYGGGPNEGFVIKIIDNGSTPSITWGQWLGGSGSDQVYALAVSNNNIYAGGNAQNATAWESFPWQGSYSGAYEGFVVKVVDGATPSIAWGQWLGGSSSNLVEALAVDNNNIYAGGYARTDASSWGESITWQGSYSGVQDGFVVKIVDGTTPSTTWGQWLGGSSYDEIYSLAANGDKIYAGGYTQTDSASWGESIPWHGTYSGDNEGFVIKIKDGTTPSIVWGQWLGGSGADNVNAVVVNNDEIYAGGKAAASEASWGESITWQGSYIGGGEVGSGDGFVVKIDDFTGAVLRNAIFNNAIINN